MSETSTTTATPDGLSAALGAAHLPVNWQITSSAIGPVAELAQKAAARVQFLQIPAEALPASELLSHPHLTVIIGADGKPEIRNLKSEIDAYRTKPAFREGTAQAGTIDSFIALVNRHASADTAIFVDANWKAPKLLAVVDYHARSGNDDYAEQEPVRTNAEAGEDALARNCRHRIAYAFPLSEAWQLWVGKDGAWFDQAEFAEFLEDHIHEIAAPLATMHAEIEVAERLRTRIASPAEIMDLARGLDVKVGAAVKNRVKLSSGETQFVFEQTHHDSEGRELTVPGLFILSVPIFYRDEAVRLPVRLRYRVAGGSIKWSFQMNRPDEAVDATVRDIVEQVTQNTGLPVYDGAPETK
ncbi:hypothetical protein BV511_03050 [Methylorubrum extorquens]|uniref:DUF2303 family protein n=1 Tax=Methylorubrum extorquens TaxID=408 RepID=UPI00097285D4|nr:DUF2303 family protein [Methylorubrum extorquens]APX83795.1 hypothetical protein BV511_03050 [Methylorubrum extorquens]